MVKQVEIKTLKDLRQRASEILTYMDRYYGDELMYGRITLAEQLLSEIYKKDISLDAKIDLTQKLINKTAYTKNDKFNL